MVKIKLFITIISTVILSKSALSQSNRRDILEENLYLSCSNINSNSQTIIYLSDTVYGDDHSYGYVYEFTLNNPFTLDDSSIETLIEATDTAKFNYAIDDVGAKAFHYIGSKAYKAGFENITLYQFVDGNREFRQDYWQTYASINRFTGQYMGSGCAPITYEDFYTHYLRWRENLEARFEQMQSNLLF